MSHLSFLPLGASTCPSPQNALLVCMCILWLSSDAFPVVEESLE